MSDKARRSNAWDDRHLRGPLLWPARAAVKALSSITLAVVLLSFVVLYGVSASVPVGLLALAPTYVIYALALVALLGVVAVLPAWGVRRVMAGRSAGARFAASFGTLLLLAGVGAWVWAGWVWPALRYDAVTGSGLRLFAGFAEANKAVTVRRLPWVEMTELEYYAAWPLKWALLLFVLNMVVATVRRIEFTFKNIGVLTVHTGIVVMALGSVYYSGLKVEGDTVLVAGPADPHTGQMARGAPQPFFHDNTRVSLYISSGGEGAQRPLKGIPRYNDRGLTEGGESLRGALRFGDDGSMPPSLPALSIPVERMESDGDVSFRVVGYSGYNDDEPRVVWVPAEAPPAGALNPLTAVYLHTSRPDEKGVVSDEPATAFKLFPASPKDRFTTVRDQQGDPVFSVEVTAGEQGMSESRWRDLQVEVPEGTGHALVMEVPGAGGGTRVVAPVQAGTVVTVGETGYRVGVKRLEARPSMPLITQGYRGAESSLAVVEVTEPSGKVYERFVYHRFPEINQDILPELRPNGMPVRRNADPSIRIGLVECDAIYAYINERADGSLRAVVRQKGGHVHAFDPVPPTGRFAMFPDVSLRVGERWAHARGVVVPSPAQPARRDPQLVGTHQRSMLGLEVTTSSGYRDVVWLPFRAYPPGGLEGPNVRLPDGREFWVEFGRTQHQFPGFQVQLLDFQMLAFDHRGAPRDYQSLVRVMPMGVQFEAFEHVVKLNEPLQAPFNWDDGRSWLWNLPRRLAAGMNPNQFKLSQASWDERTWRESQAQVDAGALKRPYVRHTVLGVGNNPGIHMIAAGGVMMGVGVPWAFYVKPWLVRREKRRVQEAVKAGAWRKPESGKRKPEVETAGV